MRKRLLTLSTSNLVISLLLFIIGILVFKRFFGFSLWGDDWMIMYYTLEHKLDGIPLQIFFSAYGGQAILMDIIKTFFGFEPRYYFYVSYLLRFIAGLSIYYLSKELTKSKIFGFLASIFFLTSFIGIESTDWVHNSINYLSLALTCFGFIYIFRAKDNKKVISKNIIIPYTLFTVAIVLAAVRMHGLIFLYPLTESLFVFAKYTTLKKAFIRSLIVVIIFFVLAKAGLFGSVGGLVIGRINASFISYIRESPENIYRAVLFPFGSFFNSLFPLYTFSNSPFLSELFFNIEFGFTEITFWAISFLIIEILVIRKLKHKSWMFILIWVFWVIFLFFVKNGFSRGLGIRGSGVLLGGGILIMNLNLVAITFILKKREMWVKLFFLIFWPFCFLVTPHAFNTTNTTIDSLSRYMTLTTGGSQILLMYTLFILANLINLIKKRVFKILSYLFILIVSIFIICSNLVADEKFFSASKYRLNGHVFPVWNSFLKAASDITYNGRIRIFVFEYDNLEAYQTMIGFGGWYRFALYNKIYDRQHLITFLGSNETGLLSKAFVYPNIGVDAWGPVIEDYLRLDDVYGFILKGDTVTRNDLLIRQKLLAN